jgi:hypothetical protein
MPQTQYNLHLKGFVGGADFDRNYVDYVLAKNTGKDVNVLMTRSAATLPPLSPLPLLSKTTARSAFTSSA